MANTTTIYRVTAMDHMIRHWHFATKAEAKDFARQWKKDEGAEYDLPDIEPVTVTMNARGIAQALDDFINMTCANEG